MPRQQPRRSRRPSRRKSEAERAAFPRSGVDRERAPFLLDRPLRQIEPVSRPAAARLLELAHPAELEDLRRVLRIDADAVVADADLMRAVVLRRNERDLPLALLAVGEEERV